MNNAVNLLSVHIRLTGKGAGTPYRHIPS